MEITKWLQLSWRPSFMVRTRCADPQAGVRRIFVPQEPSCLCLSGSSGTGVIRADTDAAQSLWPRSRP